MTKSFIWNSIVFGVFMIVLYYYFPQDRIKQKKDSFSIKLLPLKASRQALSTDTLFRILHGDKWGCIDTQGNVVLRSCLSKKT